MAGPWTPERVWEFLCDPRFWDNKRPYNGFHQSDRPKYAVVRKNLVLPNGRSVSIQHSATHYCNDYAVEMWRCLHHPMLGDVDNDGFRSDPYGWVSFDTVAKYLNWLEKQPPLKGAKNGSNTD